MSHRTAPNEKNQNSSPAQSRCVTAARAKAVKNVCVRMAQAGNKKIAKINFTQRVGTMSGSGAGTILLARATFRTFFTRRIGLRLPRLVVDLCLVAAKVIRRLRRLAEIWKREIEFLTADYTDGAITPSESIGLRLGWIEQSLARC